MMQTISCELSIHPSSFFSEEELRAISEDPIPSHVAIIMDGNRRWAKKRRLPASVGHWRGAETLTKIVRAASQLGIKTLTVFSFSTENWKRSPLEINTLMQLIKIYLLKQRESMLKEGVKLETIGDLSRLPRDVQEELAKTKLLTRNSETIELILALNYGGRDEIRRALIDIIKECQENGLDPKTLTENDIANHLDSAKWEDPSLVIRTSGENRMSNFLLWQTSYSEVIFFDDLWPDFTEKHLLKAVLEYQRRERRIGG